MTKLPSPTILSSDDHCHRLAYLIQRYTPPALTPKEILTRAIEHGLTSTEDDYAQAASDFAMELCTANTIDTEQTDLLGLAEHISSLAQMVVWVGRTKGPWKRPDDLQNWHSGAFLSEDERRLRILVCVDRWDAFREMELRSSWQVAGECSAYQVPMDIIVVVIGKLRNGRWVSPWTTGYRHPVAKDLRFRKRDGESFGPTWEKVWREGDPVEWLDAMTDDGVLWECVRALTVDVPERETVTLSVEMLERISGESKIPRPQLSNCFNRMRLCPFRSCCPHGRTPEELGFLKLSQ